MKKPIIALKNWYVDNYCYDCLYGNAYGHSKFENGTFIGTGSIIKATNESNKIVVKTRNHIYTCYFEDAHEDNFNNLDMLEMLELFVNKEEEIKNESVEE